MFKIDRINKVWLVAGVVCLGTAINYGFSQGKWGPLMGIGVALTFGIIWSRKNGK